MDHCENFIDNFSNCRNQIIKIDIYAYEFKSYNVCNIYYHNFGIIASTETTKLKSKIIMIY